MRRSVRNLALGISLFMASAGAAHAELVTFQVTATVNFVDDPGYLLEGTIQQGDQISGTYTIDTGTPDEDPSLEYALYRHAPASGIGFDISAGGHRFATAPNSDEFFVFIADSSYGDHFGVQSFMDIEPLANGTLVQGIMMELDDPSGTANTQYTALLPTAPNLDAYGGRMFFIDGAAPDFTGGFHIDATVTSITGGVPTPATGPVTHQVKAVIEYINDPYNKLSNVAMGDVITANYTFDPNTPDQDPAPEHGHYIHANVPGFGFEVKLGPDVIKTDSTAAEFAVHIEDGYGDFRDVAAFGAHTPLSNGATVDFIGTHVFDPTGTAHQTADLTAEVPILSAYQERWLDIGGSDFNVHARVISIEVVQPFVLSPAEGTYDRFQQFDGALILNPSLHPRHVSASLNGVDVTPFFESCIPGAPNDQDRVTLVCPGLSSLLVPGANQLDVNVELDDGSVYQDGFTYEIIGY